MPVSQSKVQDRVYNLGGIEWACPERAVVTESQEFWGWFETDEGGQWLLMGTYDPAHMRAMMAAGCERPKYDNRPI